MPALVVYVGIFRRGDAFRRSFQSGDASERNLVSEKLWVVTRTQSEKEVVTTTNDTLKEICFKSRPRRCNSDSEACRRCCASNRRPRSSRPVIRTMAIPSTSEAEPQSPTSSEDGRLRVRHQSEPSAPSPGLVLFNSEDQSDVVFLVGQKPNQWRFPGHSFIIKEASPVFESILTLGMNGMSSIERGPSNTQIQVLTNDRTKDICQIIVSDTPPDVFENVLSFVYKRDVPSLTVPSALRLYHAATHFQLSDLGNLCLDFLRDNVKEDTVLDVLPQLQRRRLLLNSGNMDPNLPSPVTEELCANSRNEVLLRCFDVIDDCAESVLRQETFEKLSYESVCEILSRDTLRIRSEMAVFEAATRWACQECKRRQMELVPENKREVLGKILYHIRYLSMSPEEFQRGPVASHILDESEKMALLARLNGDFSALLPVNLLGRKLDSRRPGPRSGLGCTTGAVAKVPTASKRPLGRSCSFTSGSSSSDRASSSRRNRHSAGRGDPKKSSTSKKFFRGLGDIVICLVQMLD